MFSVRNCNYVWESVANMISVACIQSVFNVNGNSACETRQRYVISKRVISTKCYLLITIRGWLIEIVLIHDCCLFHNQSSCLFLYAALMSSSTLASSSFALIALFRSSSGSRYSSRVSTKVSFLPRCINILSFTAKSRYFFMLFLSSDELIILIMFLF